MNAPKIVRPDTNCDHAARLGKLTASMVADATAKIKTGEAATRKAYRAQLVAERLTGVPQGADLSFSKAVAWGNDCEPLARAAFEAETGLMVLECGFVDHPTITNSGCSPDGLIGKDALVEFKCPNTTTHIEYLKAGTVPSEYRKQIIWQLACTGRTQAYFASYDPRLDACNQLLIVQFSPTADEIAELEAKSRVFLDEVAADVDWLRNRAAGRAAPNPKQRPPLKLSGAKTAVAQAITSRRPNRAELLDAVATTFGTTNEAALDWILQEFRGDIQFEIRKAV